MLAVRHFDENAFLPIFNISVVFFLPGRFSVERKTLFTVPLIYEIRMIRYPENAINRVNIGAILAITHFPFHTKSKIIIWIIDLILRRSLQVRWRENVGHGVAGPVGPSGDVSVHYRAHGKTLVG